jgi:hypothetical protein
MTPCCSECGLNLTEGTIRASYLKDKKMITLCIQCWQMLVNKQYKELKVNK